MQTICKSSDPDLSSVKFQNYWPKTAGGVGLTRHPEILTGDWMTGDG